jgi:4-amino-4-deoxy-L-arabinose transferase-like glycosyltransferase
VLLVAVVARELGGTPAAQALAAVGAAATTGVQAYGHTLSPGSVDLPVWVAVCWLVIRLLRTGHHRLWLAIGLVTGVGLLAKDLVLLLVLALVAGVLVAGPRVRPHAGYLAAGASVAAVVAAPALLWQALNGWPQFAVAEALTGVDPNQTRISFLPAQLLLLGPALAPIWVAGLVRLLRAGPYRAIGVAYLVGCLVLLVLAGQPRYLTGLLLVLLAAGSVAVGEWAAGRTRQVLVALVVVANAAFTAVAVLPVLPVSWYVDNPVLAGLGGDFQLQQTGWPELSEQVAAVVRDLPDGERAAVVTDNYGVAGALDRYGSAAGVEVYSPHNSYADFGRPADDVSVVVVIAADPDYFTPHFATCEERARLTSDNPWIGEHVLVCRGPEGSWADLWRELAYLGDRRQAPGETR